MSKCDCFPVKLNLSKQTAKYFVSVVGKGSKPYLVYGLKLANLCSRVYNTHL